MLNSATTTAERNRLLAMTIDSALEQERIEPERAICCSPTDLIREVVPQLNHLPILVIEAEADKQRLVGILTPFDLL